MEVKMEKKQISVKITKDEIVIENPPHNKQIEVRNMQNKCIYSENSEHSQIMKIKIQTEETQTETYIINVEGENMLLFRHFGNRQIQNDYS
jgi:stress response protein YsnF